MVSAWAIAATVSPAASWEGKAWPLVFARGAAESAMVVRLELWKRWGEVVSGR